VTPLWRGIVCGLLIEAAFIAGIYAGIMLAVWSLR